MFPLSPEKIYCPDEITRWFGIPRTSLFRLEKNGMIDPTERGKRDSRQYSFHHVLQLINITRDDIGDRIAERVRHGQQMMDQELLERLFRVKILQDPSLGLAHMHGLSTVMQITPYTSNLLIEAALKLPIGDQHRIDVWAILIQSDLIQQRRGY